MPTSDLTFEDKQKLFLALSEMKSRGLSIPRGMQYVTGVDWPVGENDYFVKANGKAYKPSEKTAHCINSRARFFGLFGGRGSGKSATGVQKALRKIRAGQSGAVINPDFENFRYSTWPEFREWIPWNMVIPSQRYRKSPQWQPRQPFVLVFMNGARVYCKGLKNPDSARGPNMNWAWYDEGGRDPTGLSFRLLSASVRVGPDPAVWVTGTPKGKQHWMYEFFIEQKIPKEISDLLKTDHPLIESEIISIEDNKENLDPEYYASMLATYPTGWLRDQELYGKFADEGGTLGDPAWFMGKTLPEPRMPMKKRVRFWDLAASAKDHKKNRDPDSTCGTLMAWDGKEDYVIEDQVKGEWEWSKIVSIIIETAERDGPDVEIWAEQEPGSGGKNQIAALNSSPGMELYHVHGKQPSGDKIIMANLWFMDAALGKVWLVRGVWIDDFIKQLSSFPSGRHDDRIDSISGARWVLNPPRKWKRIEFVKI